MSSRRETPQQRERHVEDFQHEDAFLRCMTMPGGSEEAPEILLELYQLDTFMEGMKLKRMNKAADKARKNALVPGLGKLSGLIKTASKNGPEERYSVRDMLTFQKDGIAVPMLRLDEGLHGRATEMFDEVLKYMGVVGGRAMEPEEETALVLRLHISLLKHPPLRDEIFSQLQKQTRRNPYRGSVLKAWELIRQCAAAFPPSKTVAAPFSEYLRAQTEDPEISSTLCDLVFAAWKNLDCTMRAGPRLSAPTAEEVEALQEGRTLTCSIFLFDDAVETVPYNVMTTIREALTAVTTSLKLGKQGDFGLFEWRTSRSVGSSKSEEAITDHFDLHSRKYVGDVISDFQSQSWGGYVQSRLLLKRKAFLESDTQIEDPVLHHLSYIQLKCDYLAGHYRVPSEVAAPLAALQILAEKGAVKSPEASPDWGAALKRAFPKDLLQSASFTELGKDVSAAYKSLTGLSKEQAEEQFTKVIMTLPHGGSLFYNATLAEDSAQLFSPRVVLAIGKQGVQISNQATKEHLHFVELRDISHYAASPERIFFAMQISGEVHTAEFVTSQGAEIAALLDKQIQEIVKALQNDSKQDSSFM